MLKPTAKITDMECRAIREACLEVVSAFGRSSKIDKVEIARTALMLVEEGVSIKAGKIDAHVLAIETMRALLHRMTKSSPN